jgi:hypothetical protein
VAAVVLVLLGKTYLIHPPQVMAVQVLVLPSQAQSQFMVAAAVVVTLIMAALKEQVVLVVVVMVVLQELLEQPTLVEVEVALGMAIVAAQAAQAS